MFDWMANLFAASPATRMMRWVFTGVTIVGIALGFGGAHLAAAADGTPPNVVLIILDTARADRVSFNGYGRITTPNLDKLAQDGVVYSNAHSVSPWTLPSHMSMFTGLLPGQHGATWRAFSEPEDMALKDIVSRSFSLSDPSQMLTVRLQEMGYNTVGFSSNAWVAKRTGFATGFDAFYEMWKVEDGYRSAFRWLPPKVRQHEWAPEDYRTVSELETGDAGKVLRAFHAHFDSREALRQPFFFFFNFIDPHYPYSPPMSWRYAYSQDTTLGEQIANFQFQEMAMQAGARPVDVSRFSPFYDAEINYVDFAVGRFLNWLREKDLYDNTLIIVTSDHGEHLGEDGHFSHQFSVEEELLHIPLIIKYPGNANRGEIVDNPLVSNLDVYETILAATAGDAGRASPPTASRDLRDMQRFDRTHLIAEYAYSLPYLRANQGAYPEFSVAENSVYRRVVYDHNGRHEFADPDRFTVAPVAGNESSAEGLEQATTVLKDYLQGLAQDAVRHAEEPMDEETLQRLRSLGYVD